MSDNPDLFPVIKRSKKTEPEFFNALKNYKYKVNNEYYVSEKLANLRRKELICAKELYESGLKEQEAASERIGSEIAEDEAKSISEDSLLHFEDDILQKGGDDKAGKDSSRYYEGYFKQSYKFPKAFISSGLVIDNKLHIVISNDIREKGYYQCYIRPMHDGATGFIVTKFERNLFKERIERRKFFSHYEKRSIAITKQVQENEQKEN
jgi:hypothetical protein